MAKGGRPGRSGVYTRHGVVARRAFVKLFRENFEKDKQRLSHELSGELRAVAESIMDDAAKGLQQALQIQVLEEGQTLNNMLWPITSPESIVAAMPVLTDIEESGKKTSILVKGLNSRELDEIDRRGSPVEVNVLIKSQRGQYNVKGVQCDVKTLTIRPRRETRIDKVGKRSWATWRALEYGQVSGKFVRVKARTVRNVTKSKGGDIVDYGEWVVFMSARGSWWTRVADMTIDNIVVDTPQYWGGSHPIALAVEGAGERVDKAVRAAMRRAL